MTSKEPSRPINQHRLSVGSPASLPTRRSHSHSISLGSTSGTHRINRRKSSTFGPKPNLSAAVEIAVADGTASIRQRTPASRAALGSLNDSGSPALPHSLPHRVAQSGKAGLSESALEDGPALASFSLGDKAKVKVRRASDGTRLAMKKEKHVPGDLKCEHCGKTYKHGSCLHKHRWEHTPQWQLTSKLLISKHQQVQLLEAASALMNMNQDGTAVADSDSSSPGASGSSDLHDDSSSPEPTPPPLAGEADSKRFSNNSSTMYSRSYQSVFSEPQQHENPFAHNRNWSASTTSRPLTANTSTSIAESYKDEDPADLAAAVGLLSCSYGTPKSGANHLGTGVPPVPPVPEKYQSHSYRPQHQMPDRDDVDMDEESEDSDRAPEEDDEHQDGMFALDA